MEQSITDKSAERADVSVGKAENDKMHYQGFFCSHKHAEDHVHILLPRHWPPLAVCCSVINTPPPRGELGPPVVASSLADSRGSCFSGR